MSIDADIVEDYRQHKREGDAMGAIQRGEWSACRSPTPNLTIAGSDRGTLWMVRYTDDETGYEGEIGIFLGVKAEAHARLFAVSPGLLEAATALLAAWDNNDGSGRLSRKVVDGLRDAIAKATAQPSEAPR